MRPVKTWEEAESVIAVSIFTDFSARAKSGARISHGWVRFSLTGEEKEQRVHKILLFMGGMAAFVGIGTAAVALGLWAVSLEDMRSKRYSSFLLSAIFWPLLPLFSWFRKRDSIFKDSRRLPAEGLTGGVQSSSKDQCPKRLGTIREAMEYLAGRIASEAEWEGMPLSEVERKMLYFTESGWTLPDMKKVSAEFDRDYDQDIYERKIARLVSNIQARDNAQSKMEQEVWDSAVEKLSEGDHYLLVLIDAEAPQENPAKHWLKILVAVLLFIALGVLNICFKHWQHDH
jgi:hypothetical protein